MPVRWRAGRSCRVRPLLMPTAISPTTPMRRSPTGRARCRLWRPQGYALNLFNDLPGGALTGAGIHHEGAPSSIQSGNNMLSSSSTRSSGGSRRDGRRHADYLAGSLAPCGKAACRCASGEASTASVSGRGRDGIDLDDATREQVLGAGERVGLARTALIAEIGGGGDHAAA